MSKDLFLQILADKQLAEAKVFIQVIDPRDAIIELQKAGVRATPNKKMDDEIVVDTKDKKKVLQWMLKSGGWEKRDIKDLYPELMEDNTNDVSDDGDGMDKVQPKALKKKFKDRKDQDIDNDGDVDDSDEYLHNRRKTVSKAIQKEEADLDEGLAGAALGALGGHALGKAYAGAAGKAASKLAGKAGAGMLKRMATGAAAAKYAPAAGAVVGGIAGHQATKRRNEEVELDEAMDQKKFSAGAKAMKAYAQKNGGVDKKDFMEVSKLLDQIGRVNILQAGQLLSRLNRLVDGMDTDVRERIFVELKKVGLVESVELDEDFDYDYIMEEYSDVVFETTAAALEEQGIDWRELDEEELNEFIGRAIKAVGRGIKRQTVDRVTTTGRTARLNRQAAKDQKKADNVNALKQAQARAAKAKAAKKKAVGPSTADKVRAAASKGASAVKSGVKKAMQ